MCEARERLVADGLNIKNTSTGHQRAHPAATILRHARQAYLKSLEMLFEAIGRQGEGVEDEFDRF